MNADWLTLGAVVGAVALGWRVYTRIDARFDALHAEVSAIKERLARIEGWIAGRFREDVSA